MPKSYTHLISQSLSLPDDAAVYELSHRLTDEFSDSFILETSDYDFDLGSYAEAGRCSMYPIDGTHSQLEATWLGTPPETVVKPRNGFFEIFWRGKRLRCLSITIGDCDTHRYYLIADDPELVRNFFAAVCDWSAEVNDEILVFRGGSWRKDKALREQIERATFDSLILPGALRDELIADFEGFFEAKDVYRQLGVAWKRGILLLGPPGNGKTHCIKALVNRLKRPCLYVRTFKSARATMYQSIEAVFAKARQIAPCILVLEDLDSLVDDETRSCLLNEMDGFAENEGILTVATTNHPKKLDPALLERPSRFDRKITFALPAREERGRFLTQANAKRLPAAQVSEADLDLLADITGGFSFAYLQELGLSGLMAWMRDPVPGTIGQVMAGQVDTLRRQMRTEKPPTRSRDEEDEY